MEAALRAKASGDAVIALAWGDEANREALRKALAMGVDRAAWTAGDPVEAAKALGAEKVFASTRSPQGADPLPWRLAGVLGRGPDFVDLSAPDAFAPRIPNALAAMKSAKREIEVVAAPADSRLVLRWATLIAAEEA